MYCCYGCVCAVEKHEEEEEEGEEEGEGEGEEEESSEEPWEEFPEDEVKEDLEWAEGWGGGEGGDVEVDQESEGASETPGVESGLESGRWSLAGSRAGGGDRGDGYNIEEKMAPSPPSRTGGMKLSGSLKLGSGRTKEGGKVNSSENEKSAGKEYGSTRTRLSEEDRLRLEEQATWSREPDFFADMTPTVGKKSLSLHNATKVSMETERTKSSLQYQSTGTEEVREESLSLSLILKYFVPLQAGGAWGSWNDF